MKLAILGMNSTALEAAVRFHLHGAQLTWFCEGQLPPTKDEEVTQLGLGLINQSSINSWENDYLKPLMSFLKSDHRIKTNSVLSISKRYLALDEVPAKSSRFLDLFRIIYQVNPTQFIEEQKELNPETYQRLSDEFVNSLQDHIEMYEDFDMVLDFRTLDVANSISVTGRALGEKRISNDYVIKSNEILSWTKNLTLQDDVREIALVGSNYLAAQAIINLGTWLNDLRTRVFVISHEEDPFAEFLRIGESEIVSKLSNILKGMDDQFEKEVNDFHAKLREWQALDDFIQVKKPRPVEPIPRLVFFSAHNASAVDQLIDKRRLFLTLEKPDFRTGKKQPENNLSDLKTIGVDRVLVAGNLSKKHLELHLNSTEKGFFSLNILPIEIKNAWDQNLKLLKGIEDEIFLLFSPADTP